MKKYTSEKIAECTSRYVYGPAYFYDKYEIVDSYLYGIGNKKTYYIDIGSEHEFLDIVYNIGKELYDSLFNSLTSISIEDISPSFLDPINIEKNKKVIMNIIEPFILEYGLPFNYDDVKNNYKENNSNNIGTICTILLLTYMIPMISHATHEDYIVKKMLSLLNAKFEEKNNIIEELLNNLLKRMHYATLFEIKYINNYCVFVCRNIFAFAFNTIMLNIVKGDITTTCKRCGKVITQPSLYKTENNYWLKPPKYCDSCMPIIKERKKLSKSQLDNEQYTKKIIRYNRIKTLREKLQKYDKDTKYKKLINDANSIKNHNYIRFKNTNSYDSCDTLITKLENAIEKLKNDRK